MASAIVAKGIERPWPLMRVGFPGGGCCRCDRVLGGHVLQKVSWRVMSRRRVIGGQMAVVPGVSERLTGFAHAVGMTGEGGSGPARPP